MPLIKHGSLAADPWLFLDGEEALPASGAVAVSFPRWQVERERLAGRNAPLGLHIDNNQPVEELAGEVERFALIALNFPKFNDGRAYSQARILRERLGYRGELRARGRVLRDQLLFMHRCGFDAFEVANDDAVQSWAAAIAEYSVFYQPTGDGRPSLLRRRA
ncbi:MAG TPA: DUF934 domain-containing protein [Roseiflexaceae bacterium]|nr:DUF934 domain-containing protein [Roseiflexaceae bacterium]